MQKTYSITAEALWRSRQGKRKTRVLAAKSYAFRQEEVRKGEIDTRTLTQHAAY